MLKTGGIHLFSTGMNHVIGLNGLYFISIVLFIICFYIMWLDCGWVYGFMLVGYFGVIDKSDFSEVR